MKKRKSIYSLAFRKEVLTWVTQQDYNYDEVGLVFSMSGNTIKCWHREIEVNETIAFSKEKQSVSERNLIKKLEARIKQLEKERDAYKKAMYFFKGR